MHEAGTESEADHDARSDPHWREAPDRLVIAACRGGDREAWSELVGRYASLVYSIPRRYGLDVGTSEDVAQEAFCILFQQLQTLRNPEALPKWMMTTTHRVACEAIRKSRRIAEVSAGVSVEVLARAAPSDDTLEAWERQHLVRAALRRLGGRCEELLTALHADDPPSYEVLADLLGMPLGSIGPTRIRCLKKLMDLVDEQ
ncbi:MAG: RNA polymerase sigma factor [Planctomycetota bacterium]|jgi:RNA polymerase sigma factor (sigma-70 family)